LGLPGETKESFIGGVEATIAAAPDMKLFIYHCSILPNTEMDFKEYRAKHGLITQFVPMTEIHASPRAPGVPQEFEEIIVGTNAMPVIDWMACAVYSWKVQLNRVFGMEPTLEISAMFANIAFGITIGQPRGQLLEGFGNLYWEPEEAAFLLMSKVEGDKEKFARENVLFARKGK
jgi:hypothetical protein